MATNQRESLSLDDVGDFFGVKELAALLQIGEARAYELTRRRNFPAMRLSGRTIRISKTGFQRWQEQNFGIESESPAGRPGRGMR